MYAIYNGDEFRAYSPTTIPMPDGFTLMPLSKELSRPLASGERWAAEPSARSVVDGVCVEIYDPEPTPVEEIAAALKRAVADAVQRHLDATVSVRNYASAAAAVSYVGDPNPKWDAEGRAVQAWRSAVWTVCFAALDDVLAGERPPLTPDEMVAELPALVWPAVA